MLVTSWKPFSNNKPQCISAHCIRPYQEGSLNKIKLAEDLLSKTLVNVTRSHNNAINLTI